MQTNLEITILVFSLHLDLPVAWAALRAGARGFLHSSMEACQVVRAADLATKGVLVAPRKLLEYLVNEEFVDTGSPSMHQREILTHVADGLSKAEIAERLNLSEIITKQHLRHAYKVLRVKTRIEAADLFRNQTWSRIEARAVYSTRTCILPWPIPGCDGAG